MRSHPKKLHLLMPDAAPRGDYLYLYSVYDYVIYDKMINIYLSSLSSCNVGVSTHTHNSAPSR